MVQSDRVVNVNSKQAGSIECLPGLSEKEDFVAKATELLTEKNAIMRSSAPMRGVQNLENLHGYHISNRGKSRT